MLFGFIYHDFIVGKPHRNLTSSTKRLVVICHISKYTRVETPHKLFNISVTFAFSKSFSISSYYNNNIIFSKNILV